MMTNSECKPIFIVRFPESYREHWSDIQDQIDILRRHMPDYYVLATMCAGNEIKYQAFYAKDFKEVEYEELKTMINDSLMKIK